VDPQRDSAQTAPVKNLFQGQIDQDNGQKGNIHHGVSRRITVQVFRLKAIKHLALVGAASSRDLRSKMPLPQKTYNFIGNPTQMPGNKEKRW
jgi:hypothetical protein